MGNEYKIFSDATDFAAGGPFAPTVANFPALKLLILDDDQVVGTSNVVPRYSSDGITAMALAPGSGGVAGELLIQKDADGFYNVAATGSAPTLTPDVALGALSGNVVCILVGKNASAASNLRFAVGATATPDSGCDTAGAYRNDSAAISGAVGTFSPVPSNALSVCRIGILRTGAADEAKSFHADSNATAASGLCVATTTETGGGPLTMIAKVPTNKIILQPVTGITIGSTGARCKLAAWMQFASFNPSDEFLKAAAAWMLGNQGKIYPLFRGMT